MKGDNTQSDTNPFGADSDNDYDDGVFQQTPAAAGLPKLGSRNRRLTIEPGDHEKLLLTEGSNIYATVLTDEDIVQSFTESPNYWCTAMRTSVKNAEKLRQRNLQMETEVEQIRASARTSVNNVKTIKNQLEQSDAQVARLRQLRDSYKEHYQNLSVEFQKLKEKIAARDQLRLDLFYQATRRMKTKKIVLRAVTPRVIARHHLHLLDPFDQGRELDVRPIIRNTQMLLTSMGLMTVTSGSHGCSTYTLSFDRAGPYSRRNRIKLNT